MNLFLPMPRLRARNGRIHGDAPGDCDIDTPASMPGGLQAVDSRGRAFAVTTRHVSGHYAEGGWLTGNGRPEWRDPVTTIAVNGAGKVRVTGERTTLRVQWLEGEAPVDDLTACTPPGLTHTAAVSWWVQSIGPSTPEAIPADMPGNLREAA
jgi:hypothetical protein